MCKAGGSSIKVFFMIEPLKIKDYMPFQVWEVLVDYIKPSSLQSLANGTLAVSDLTIMIVILPSNSVSTISNSSGRSLTIDNGKIYGNFSVSNINLVAEDSAGGSNNVYYIIEVENADSYTIISSENNLEIETYNSSQYMALSGENIESANISLSNATMSIQGTDYSFKAYISTDEEISSNETGLVSISAKACSNVSISSMGDEVIVSSDATLTNICTANYIGTTVNETNAN